MRASLVDRAMIEKNKLVINKDRINKYIDTRQSVLVVAIDCNTQIAFDITVHRRDPNPRSSLTIVCGAAT